MQSHFISYTHINVAMQRAEKRKAKVKDINTFWLSTYYGWMNVKKKNFLQCCLILNLEEKTMYFMRPETMSSWHTVIISNTHMYH